MSEEQRNYLAPLSWIYGLGVWFRNKFFDWKILKTKEYPIPVISIGNLTIGGTGKTPHTEYLIHLLSKRYKIAVLSRGYKRKTSGFVLADDGATVETIGDEPYQMYRKFSNTLVAVDEKRQHGIEKLLSLEENIRPEIIILDDAFQHRYVTPSYSILLSDYQRLYYEDKLLPAGRLREPAKNAHRASMIIISKCPESLKPIDYRIMTNHANLFPFQSLFFTSFKYKSLVPLFPESTSIKREDPERLKKEKYSLLSVTGIANPKPMLNYLKRINHNLNSIVFPDHYSFKKGDINEIIKQFNSLTGENKLIITTEKDAVRLVQSAFIPEEYKPYFYYLPIEVFFNLDQEDLFIKKIEDHVRNVKRNRILAETPNTRRN